MPSYCIKREEKMSTNFQNKIILANAKLKFFLLRHQCVVFLMTSQTTPRIFFLKGHNQFRIKATIKQIVVFAMESTSFIGDGSCGVQVCHVTRKELGGLQVDEVL